LISLVAFFSSPLIYFMLIVSWKCVERPIDSYYKYKTVWLTLWKTFCTAAAACRWGFGPPEEK